MGQFEKSPHLTYHNWVERLFRLQPPEGLPENERKIIGMALQIFATKRLDELDGRAIGISFAALGNGYRIFGHDRLASALYSKALSYYQEDADTRYNLANCFQRRGSHELAVKNYQMLLASAPNYYTGHVNISASLRELNRWAEAREHLLIAISLRPEEDLAYRALVIEHCRKKVEFEDSLRAFFDLTRTPHIRKRFLPFFFGSCNYAYILTSHPVLHIPPAKKLATFKNTMLFCRAIDFTLRFKNDTIDFGTYEEAIEELIIEARMASFEELSVTCHLLLASAYGAHDWGNVEVSNTRGGYDISDEFLNFLPVVGKEETKSALFGVIKNFKAAFDILWAKPEVVKNLNYPTISNFMMGNLVRLHFSRDLVDEAVFLIHATSWLFSRSPTSRRLKGVGDIRKLRSTLKPGRGVLVMFLSEIMDDIMNLVLLTRDGASLFQCNLDCVVEKELSPGNFILASREGIEFVTPEVESAFFRNLVLPMEDELSKLDHLSIVPYSYFRNLPLDLLGGETSLASKYQCTVDYLPSLANSGFCRPETRARKCLFIAFAGTGAAPLQVDGELKAVRSHFPDFVFIEDLPGAERSTERSLGGATYDYIHIAGHCGFDAEKDDFFVSLKHGKRYTSDFSACFHNRGMHVFINACRTGSAILKNYNWDTTVSLAAGFLQAGSMEIVATFWPVRDAAAAEMARAYYRYLLVDELEPSIAIREAQRELAAAGRPRSDWGAYFVTSAI